MSASGKRKHITLRIPREEGDKLEALARENERSVSAEVRVAVRKHLKEAA